MGTCVEEQYGGLGKDYLSLAVAVEELSRGCASTGMLLSIHNFLYANLVNEKGTPEQKEQFLRDFTKGSIGCFALSEPGNIFSYSFFNFMLYPAHSIVCRKKLIWRHSSSHFYVEWRNSTPRFPSTPHSEEMTILKIHFLEWKSNPELVALYIHTLCTCATTGLYTKNCFIIIVYIYLVRHQIT